MPGASSWTSAPRACSAARATRTAGATSSSTEDLGGLPVAAAERARRLRLPARPHAPQLLRGPNAGARRDALQVKASLRHQLPCQCEADQLHVIVGRAAGVLGEQARQVAGAGA